MTYNWQMATWPQFHFETKELERDLLRYAEKVGAIAGRIRSLSNASKLENTIDILITEAVKTSAIEGEIISREDVRSSIRNELGLNARPEKIADIRAQGIAKIMIDLQKTFAKPLSQEMLFDWHQMLFYGQERNTSLEIGTWRTHPEAMQVVSGPYGKWQVHFEAPPSNRVPTEMKNFIAWFNQTAPKKPKAILHAPIRAAIAHLYFESIHPFEDGNGRIGRAISQKVLSQQAGFLLPLSLSESIEADRKTYYNELKKAQHTDKITPWLHYFIAVILDAQTRVERSIDFILLKSHFLDSIKEQLNPRQEKVIQRILKEGPGGFTGGMTAKKYAAIAKCSKATATRELSALLAKGILLKKPSGGRSTAYDLNLQRGYSQNSAC